MDLVLLFGGQFASVFAMVFSSKLLRDDRVYMAMINSYLITATQLAFVHIISTSDFSWYLLLCVGGAGGSLGVFFSHHTYLRMENRSKKK